MEGWQKSKPYIVILVVYFVMACLNLLYKKVVDEGMNQLVIVTYRLTAAAIFLMPIAYFYERKRNDDAKLTRSILFYLFFSALIGATLTQYLFLLGIKFTSAAFASAFINMTPVFTFLLALPLREESVNLKSKGGKAKVLGSLICIGGVFVLIFYRGIPLNKKIHSGMSSYNANNLSLVAKIAGMQRWIIGSIFLVLSILCWACWFLIQSRISKRYPCKYSSTALISALGAVQSSILCFVLNRSYSIWILKDKLQILAVLSAGIFGSGLCYVGMTWCVEQKGPVFTSAFTPFIQIFIAILDLAFFHEQFYLGSVIGSIMVISGLYILLWGKSCEVCTSFNKQAEVAYCHRNIAIDMTLVTNSGCSS